MPDRCSPPLSCAGLENHPDFAAVRTFLEAMLDHGRGVVGGAPCPLFGGVIDVARREVNTALTVPPPGIRISDFNWCGNNVTHEIPLLESLLIMSELTGEPRWAEAVDAVFAYYGDRCPHPATGLFPWGEHAQWSFADERILPCSFSHGMRHFLVDDYLVHDHLTFVPGWFWERMWAPHPEAVVRFARGLDRHIVDRRTFEHNRHAPMGAGRWRDPDRPDGDAGKDFARHAGFFIFDCVFAYARSGETDLLDWARRKLAWHVDRRLPTGIIRGCARTPGEEREGQHDPFALAVAKAAELLGETSEGRELADVAAELFAARARQKRGAPVTLPDEPGDGRLWVGGYFRRPPVTVTGGSGLLQMQRGTGEAWYADQAAATARWLEANLPEPPAGVPVLARRFAGFIDAALAGHAVTGDEGLLDLAERIAGWARRDLARQGLLMGCSHQRLFLRGANTEYHVDAWAEPPTPGAYYSVAGAPALALALLRVAHVRVTGQEPPAVEDLRWEIRNPKSETRRRRRSLR